MKRFYAGVAKAMSNRKSKADLLLHSLSGFLHCSEGDVIQCSLRSALRMAAKFSVYMIVLWIWESIGNMERCRLMVSNL
ncbi:hypothetical protein JZ751_022923 [Albula glossodonta]|uniref:Uncharacterized protein n=1 Tax=Albula glossodonta TaxID=121402 RepID=A0A8T2PMI0_9TELE|nr:hypothetical protein JZ751_022923 [Albula glossodonta]